MYVYVEQYYVTGVFTFITFQNIDCDRHEYCYHVGKKDEKNDKRFRYC